MGGYCWRVGDPAAASYRLSISKCWGGWISRSPIRCSGNARIAGQLVMSVMITPGPTMTSIVTMTIMRTIVINDHSSHDGSHSHNASNHANHHLAAGTKQ